MLAHKTIFLSALALCASVVVGQEAEEKVGWSGELSSLDAGLGGTVTVKDKETLEITDYTLEDAGAPALYWWGATSDELADGFRISNTQVTEAADGEPLTIKLDAGYTTDEFSVVGLWCEALSVNFGQATLAEGGDMGGDKMEGSMKKDEEGTASLSRASGALSLAAAMCFAALMA